MKKKFLDIINECKKQGAPMEAVNAELKAAGANFHLNVDGYVEGWTEAEMAEGFIPAEDDGKDALYKIASDGKPVRLSTKAPAGGVYGAAVPVMDRDKSRADTTITVGYWELSYDSLGYCYSRKNLRK
jgi:hypothetical protein